MKIDKIGNILLTVCLAGFLVSSGLFAHAWLTGEATETFALGAIAAALPLILKWFTEILLPSLRKPHGGAPAEYTVTFERTVTRKVMAEQNDG